MLPGLRKTTAYLILFVLALSCSGLSFGMIGNGLMQMSGEHTNIHECCGVSETGQTDGSNHSAVEHHAPLPITAVEYFSFLVLVVVLALFAYILKPRVNRVLISSVYYTKQWREQWAYWALSVKRLFSSGILHPKIW